MVVGFLDISGSESVPMVCERILEDKIFLFNARY